MHFSVRTFHQHVALSGLFILSVEKDAAGYGFELPESRDVEGKPLVGNERAMCRKHLLPVTTLLEGTEHAFKIPLDAPLVRRDELCEAHGLKVHKACGKVFLQKVSGFRQGLVIGIGSHCEMGRGAVIAAL